MLNFTVKKRRMIIENYSVYCHTNKINNKNYVGITKQSPEFRWGIDGKNYKNKCPHLWSAIKKYGWNNFEHQIIATGLTMTEACECEKVLIEQYNANDPKYGYNILSGGKVFSIPLETRKKMSKAMKGNKNGLGKPCSEEKKMKISLAQKGRKLSEEHKKKLSLAKKGKPRFPLSEETKKKISASHKKKRVICTNTGEVFESIQSCAKQMNIEATVICGICKGRHSHTKGLHFKYYDDGKQMPND